MLDLISPDQLVVVSELIGCMREERWCVVDVRHSGRSQVTIPPDASVRGRGMAAGPFISVIPLVVVFLSSQEHWQSGQCPGSVRCPAARAPLPGFKSCIDAVTIREDLLTWPRPTATVSTVTDRPWAEFQSTRF